MSKLQRLPACVGVESNFHALSKTVLDCFALDNKYGGYELGDLVTEHGPVMPVSWLTTKNWCRIKVNYFATL
jgi:hypothetical protein